MDAHEMTDTTDRDKRANGQTDGRTDEETRRPSVNVLDGVSHILIIYRNLGLRKALSI